MKKRLILLIAIMAVVLVASGSAYTLYAGVLRQVVKEVPAAVTVRITGTMQGDCNGDGTANAADITAEVLEIFDGDGVNPSDAHLGSFAGTDGCDSNQDGTITAADIICTVLIIFNGPGACTPQDLTNVPVTSGSHYGVIALAESANLPPSLGESAGE